MSCRMPKLSVKFGFVSDRLYIAMYYYNTFRYREPLSVIEMTKINLAQPYLIYNIYVDRKKCSEAVGGQSGSTNVRQTIAVDIIFSNKICRNSSLEHKIYF